MSSPEKPKWYSIRLRILDYSQRQLANMAALCFVLLFFLSLVAMLMNADQRASLIPVGASLCGLFIAAVGAIIYKKRGGPQQSATLVRTESKFTQGALTIGYLGIIAVVWIVLQNRGVPIDTIAKILGIGGICLFGLCAFVVVVMAIRNRRH